MSAVNGTRPVAGRAHLRRALVARYGEPVRDGTMGWDLFSGCPVCDAGGDGYTPLSLDDRGTLACGANHCDPAAIEAAILPSGRFDRAHPSGNRLVTTCAADIEIKAVEFLFDGRVPVGALTLLAGDPGLGKSTWSCYLAAGVTTGVFGADPATVLMANAEDSRSHVIVPRLAAAGADLARVEFFTVHDAAGAERGFTIPDDVPLLAAKAKDCGARLVVVDPLNAHLADDRNSHNDHSIRRALAPLSTLAEDLGLAIVVLAHLNKATGADPMYRVGGSIGFTSGPRSALVFARDPDDPDANEGDRRALGHFKSSWGRKAQTLLYEHREREVTVHGVTVDTHYLEPIGTSSTPGDALLGADPEDPPEAKAERAEDVILDLLDGGEWKLASEVYEAAKRRDVSRPTVDRTARDLGVEREKRAGSQGGRARSHWRLPVTAQTTSDREVSSQKIPGQRWDFRPNAGLTAQPEDVSSQAQEDLTE